MHHKDVVCICDKPEPIDLDDSSSLWLVIPSEQIAVDWVKELFGKENEDALNQLAVALFLEEVKEFGRENLQRLERNEVRMRQRIDWEGRTLSLEQDLKKYGEREELNDGLLCELEEGDSALTRLMNRHSN